MMGMQPITVNQLKTLISIHLHHGLPIVGVSDTPCDWGCNVSLEISFSDRFHPPLWGHHGKVTDTPCDTPIMGGAITGNFIQKFYLVSTPWKIINPWGIV